MRAIGHRKYGGPEVLETIEVPEVNVGTGEVRIRIHAAAVNPTDIMSRNGSHSERQKIDPFPYVPGMDIAGIIDQVSFVGMGETFQMWNPTTYEDYKKDKTNSAKNNLANLKWSNQ